MSDSIEYTSKFLQEPHTETGEQPDLWEFQESSDIAPGSGDEGWYDVVWLDEFVNEVSCPDTNIPEIPDPDSECYSVNMWLQQDSNWIRARAIEEVPYAQSEWSEPLMVSEPPTFVLLLAGLIILAFLKRRVEPDAPMWSWKKGLRNVK
mgnify:CR=1 FL=1